MSVTTTIAATTVNHFQITHRYSSAAELPIKRVYNPDKHKFVQKIKLPNDIATPLQSDRIDLKVKICGVNYLLDFNTTNNTVIPGKRIIGKISGFPNLMFLVFPFTTCKLEGIHPHNNTCKCNLTYGESIDGGLQDNINVCTRSLIPIPLNVSLHDTCFIFDILTVFYKFVNYLKPGRTIILLNDLQKELNDILIVLKHFHIQSNKVAIIDKSMVDTKYNNKFDVVYCFNHDLLQQAQDYCVSAESKTTKPNSTILTNFKTNVTTTDKHYKTMDLTYSDKRLAMDVLLILSKLNKQRDEKEYNNVSSGNTSQHDNISLVHSTTSTNSGSSTKHHHYSWIWYDQDVDLHNYHNLHEYEDEDEDLDLNECENHQNRIIYQMNQLLNQKTLRRVCYFNRKPKKSLNACII